MSMLNSMETQGQPADQAKVQKLFEMIQGMQPPQIKIQP